MEPRTSTQSEHNNEIFVRRSALIMPANVLKFVRKAPGIHPDAVVLDLEDSITEDEKPSARAELGRALDLLAPHPAIDVLVRVNKPFHHLHRDLDEAVRDGVQGVVFPKAESEREIHVLDALLRERELDRGMDEGSLEVAVAIESSEGLFNVYDILHASDRLTAASFATADITNELGVVPSDDAIERQYGIQKLIMACAAAGLTPLGVVGDLTNYTDLDAFRQAALQGKQFGFKGSSCIHPDQVPVLNEVYSPSEEEVQTARKIVAAFEKAEAEGRGAVGVEGEMIDKPVVEQARRTLRRAQVIQTKSEGG